MSEREFEERVLRELAAIKQLVELVAEDRIAELLGRVESRYLTTPKRRQMWEGMRGGDKSYAEIGGAAGVSGEAVSQFVDQLQRDPHKLVVIDQRNGAKYPRRLF